MPSTAAIRAGQAYVELFARDNVDKGLKAVEAKLRGFSARMSAVGSKLFAGGAAALTPFGLSVKKFASYETELAKLRTAANPTAEQLVRIEAAIQDISKATAKGPAEVTASLTELLKAGMALEDVLGGAGQTALEFARVAEMDVAAAATVLTDALNVFTADGLNAAQAVDILSKAADASSISVKDVADAFSMAGAVAAQAGLSMEETANAIALLGQNGVKGSDAGTALKTMMLRLQTGAESAGVVMKELGINVRDASGEMLPMREIIAELQEKLGGLDSAAQDAALLKLFGSDAIRAGAVFLKEGADGWDEFAQKMGESLTVAEKHGIMLETAEGSLDALKASVERAAMAVGETLVPAFKEVTSFITDLADWVREFAKANPELAASAGKLAAAVAAVGAAMLAASLAAKGLAFALSPLGIVAGLAVAMYHAADALFDFGEKAESAADAQERLNRVIAAGKRMVDQGFTDRLNAAGDDPAKLQAELERQKADLAREMALAASNSEARAAVQERMNELEANPPRMVAGPFGVVGAKEAVARARELEALQAEAAQLDENLKRREETANEIAERIKQIERTIEALSQRGPAANPQAMAAPMHAAADAARGAASAWQGVVQGMRSAAERLETLRQSAAAIRDEFKTAEERRDAKRKEIERLGSTIDPTTGKPFLDEQSMRRGFASLESDALGEKIGELQAQADALRARITTPQGVAGITTNSAEGMSAIANAANGVRSQQSAELKRLVSIEDLLQRLLREQKDMRRHFEEIGVSDLGV